MAGMGTGLGSTNLTGTIATAQANNRAERQQAFKDRQIAIMEEEQAKQKAQYEQSQQQDIVSTVKNQEQQIKKLQKKQAGATSKMAIAGAAVAPAGDNVAFDFVKKVNASPELQEALQVKKGQLNAFDSQARVDDTAFMKYLDKKNIDYTAWTPEYLQQVKDSFSKSGLFYTYQGDLIDGTPLIEATNSLGMVNTNGVNIYEGKKAYLTHMLEGEEALNEAISEAMDDPEKRTWFQDYIDSLPKSEREAIAKRKKELSGKSNKEAQAELEQVAKDTDLIADPVEDPYVSSGTKQQEGNKESYPLEEPIYDEDGNEVAVKMKTRDGSEVVISEKNGEATAVTQDGTAVTKNPDGSGVAIAADGTTTTFDGEKTVTITPDGDIVEDYTLPRHVQMAYDMLGMKSSFSEDAALNRKYVEASIAKAKQRNQTFEQYLTEQLKLGNITEAEFMTQMEEYNKTKAKPTDWVTFYDEWKKDPRNEGRTLADARKDFKTGSAGSAGTLEKTYNFLLESIDPNTGKKYTPKRAMEKAQNLIKGGKDAQVKELEAMLEVETDPKRKQQLEEMIDSLGTGVGEQARQRKIADINSTQDYADSVPVDRAVKAYNGELANTADAREARRKARQLENSTNFTTDDKKALAKFKEEVANTREFKRTADKIENLVASGKYKSGMLDTMGKKLVSYLPKDVNDFLGTDDWYESARADKYVDAALVNYVRSISGLTVTDAEFQRLKSILGGDYVSEAARLADLKAFHRRLLDNVYDKGDSLYKTGFVDSVPRELALLDTPTYTQRQAKTEDSDNNGKIRKGTRTQFLNKETGVTFYKANKPYHYTKDGKLVEGVAK